MKTANLVMIAASTLSIATLSLAPIFAADTSTKVDTANAKVSAGACKGGTSCGRHEGRGRFIKELGLTDNQLEKLNALKQQSEAATAPQKAQLKTLFSEMRDDMSKPDVDKAQLVALQTKINEIRDQLSINRVSVMADRMAILTPDQRAKIREHMLQRSLFNGGGRHGRFGHHRGFSGRSGQMRSAAPSGEGAAPSEGASG